jgi:hypothetical protein
MQLGRVVRRCRRRCNRRLDEVCWRKAPVLPENRHVGNSILSLATIFFDVFVKNYYFSVQHNVTDRGVILKLAGWK